uniref:Thaumatin-like protein n=1 Tax=Aegilops tauschii TaxID=37682 RepID=M8BD32_AEGTA
MAASSSALILLLATALTAGASARSFSITNRCSFTVWPAATPAGGGRQLNNGETWNLDIPDGTSTGVNIQCRDPSCPDAYHQPNDVRTKACSGNRRFNVVFCP